MIKKPNIFDYEDYRVFIKDFFKYKKELNSVFSYRYFASKAGFSSPSYISNIMDGSRNLTVASIEKVIKGLGLLPLESQYFTAFVFYCQAKSDSEKENYELIMNKIKKSASFYSVKDTQKAFYSEWYIPILKEMIVSLNWKDDYSLLASLVRPEISEKDAKRGVEILLETGLVIKDDSGRYYEDNELLTAKNINPEIIKKQRKRYLLRGLEASDKISPKERHISYVTLAISSETYDLITKKIDDLRHEILSMSLNQSRLDKIVHVNFQLFPLTKELKKFNL